MVSFCNAFQTGDLNQLAQLLKVSKLRLESGVLVLLKPLWLWCWDCTKLVSDLQYFWVGLPMNKLRLRNVHAHRAEMGLEPWHCQQTPGLLTLLVHHTLKAHLYPGLSFLPMSLTPGEKKRWTVSEDWMPASLEATHRTLERSEFPYSWVFLCLILLSASFLCGSVFWI